ncbi:opioid growth factor receptor-like protein 1 [Neoarius graeffei]|uniref:opioid growth factor receptor-like protein 1 n=1 Tax=Neoarius graeffei TaxID=443677 RepID=UPI00298C1B90|nr:opioid growth factor receptor-like protein 1 [Neoarius graeffei]
MDRSGRAAAPGTMGNTHNPGMDRNDPSERFDSTWETEDELDDTTESPAQTSWFSQRNTYAAKDMQIYRHYYQKTLTDDETDDDDMEDDSDSPNVQFYRNKIYFCPDGDYIDYIHEHWWEDYDRLEYVHSYIQWLFPIQEKGMNYASQELSVKEIKLFRRDEEMKRRLLKSYKIMLNFYGIELVNEETGEVKRAGNWGERFENLNRNTHNNLRITRIIKCLGLLGFHHYQAPLVHFFLEETLVKGTLQRVKQSVLDYFMFAVVDKTKRQALIKFAFCNFEPKQKFVWCPRRIRNKFLKEISKLTAGTNEGISSDQSFENDQNNRISSKLQSKDETKTDTNDDKSTEKPPTSKSRNDENVSGECQDSETPALPVPIAGTENTTITNEGTEAASGVDSQHEGHRDSENKAAIQKNDSEETNKTIPNNSDENGNEIADSTQHLDSRAASDESANENVTQTSTSENLAKEAPVTGGNSENEQEGYENQGDESKQGSKEESKSQHSDGDPKENDSEEIQQSGSESPEDGVATRPATNEANSTHYPAVTSEDMNSQKYTLPPGESSTSIEPPAALMKSPESDENIRNLHEGCNQQNQSEVQICNQPKATAEANTKEESNEKKEDPVHQSKEDNTEDRFNDGDSNAVTSHSSENSDSGDVKGYSTAM